MSAAAGLGRAARPARCCSAEIRRAAGRAPAPARARGRVRRGGRRRLRAAVSSSSAWSGTAPPTTPPRTASTRSGCCRAGRRCATRSRSPSTTARRSTCAARRCSALSQSGQTPDVLEYVERARARGAFTIAITNEPALGARRLPPRPCCRSRPGPSTRSRRRRPTRHQLAALALLAGYAAGRGPGARRTASGAPPTCSRSSCPSLERRVSELAVSLAFVGRMFVIGRGPEFATAREISLKLLETCRVAAEPLTATDLVHGPVAAIDGALPGLDDRLGRREPARRARGGGAGPRRGRDADRERHGARTRSPAPRTTCRCRRRRCRC